MFMVTMVGLEVKTQFRLFVTIMNIEILYTFWQTIIGIEILRTFSQTIRRHSQKEILRW